MQVFCDMIYNWCNEIMTWWPGDNGGLMKWQMEGGHRDEYMTFGTGGPLGYSSSALGDTAAAVPVLYRCLCWWVGMVLKVLILVVLSMTLTFLTKHYFLLIIICKTLQVQG